MSVNNPPRRRALRLVILNNSAPLLKMRKTVRAGAAPSVSPCPFARVLVTPGRKIAHSHPVERPGGAQSEQTQCQDCCNIQFSGALPEGSPSMSLFKGLR